MLQNLLQAAKQGHDLLANSFTNPSSPSSMMSKPADKCKIDSAPNPVWTKPEFLLVILDRKPLDSFLSIQTTVRMKY